jgi:hypothetical protein
MKSAAPEPAFATRGTWRSRLFTIQLAVRLSLIALLLRLVELHRLQPFLLRLSPAPREPSASISFPDASELSRRVAWIAHRLPFPVDCLPQSVTIWWMLIRFGAAGDICIGVQRRGQFFAHAWVELDGRPVNDEVDVGERFQILTRLGR